MPSDDLADDEPEPGIPSADLPGDKPQAPSNAFLHNELEAPSNALPDDNHGH